MRAFTCAIILLALLIVPVVLKAVEFNIVPDMKSFSKPVVAVYYYPWYGGGLGNRHWNGDNDTVVVDKPLKGYYSSMNETAVRWQLEIMKRIGIDVLFVSWWGPWSYEDNASRILFNLLEEYGLKAALMVERGAVEKFNVSYVLNYIWNNYVENYNHSYYIFEGKPLLLIWVEASNIIGRVVDARFNIRVVGREWSYVDFSNKICVDGYVSVTPRYDEYFLALAGASGRNASRRVDPDLTLGVYVREWMNVVHMVNNIKIVAITSWNEYHERTMIEPHYDYYNKCDPYYLLRVTWAFIRRLKGGAVLSSWVANWDMARKYLESHYVDNIGLLYESDDKSGRSRIYIAADNLLASRALEVLGSELGDRITGLLSAKYANGYNNHHEVLLGVKPHWRGNTPLMGEDEILETIDGYTIIFENHSDLSKPFKDYVAYADLVALRILREFMDSSVDSAKTLWEKLLCLYDGRGFRDKAFYVNQAYDTFKLALLYYSWRSLCVVDNAYSSKYSQLIENISLMIAFMQDPATGGFRTQYSPSPWTAGTSWSTCNVETTSIIVLAYLSEYPERIVHVEPKSSMKVEITTSPKMGLNEDVVRMIIGFLLLAVPVLLLLFKPRRIHQSR